MPTAPATVVLGLSASAFWGSGDFCGGIASRRIGAMPMVAIAHGFSLFLFLALGLAFHEQRPTPRLLAIALLAGLAGCIGLVCLYRALTIGHMGLSASLSGLLTAGIPVAWSLVDTGAPATTQSLGFILAAIAICLIALAPGSPRPSPESTSRAGSPLHAFLLAMTSGACFGLLLLGMKLASTTAVFLPLAAIRCSSFALAGGWSLIAFIRRIPITDSALVDPGRPLMRKALSLALAASLLDAAGNLFYVLAVRTGRLDVASVLCSLYPAATILLAAFFLQERTSRFQAAGMILALAAVVLISL